MSRPRPGHAALRPAGGPDEPPSGLDRSTEDGPALRLEHLDAVLLDLAGPDTDVTAMLTVAAPLLERLQADGVLVAVVSTSGDGRTAIASAGLESLVDVVVDEQVIAAMALSGAPDPTLHREAARRLGVDPGRTAVVTDPADLALVGRGPLTDGWHVTYRPSGPAGEGVREALCTLANGYLGTRGATTWARDDGQHYPGTYVAGVFNRLRTVIGGRSVERESMVKAPNWLPLTFAADGGPFIGEHGTTITEDELRLDLRDGILRRRYRVTDDVGRCTTVTERRLVSMSNPHLVAIEVDVVAENWSGTLGIRSALHADGCADQTAEERLLAHHHLRLAGTGGDPGGVIWLAARTTQSDVLIAEAARTRVTGSPDPPRLNQGPDLVAHDYVVPIARNERCHVEKVVAVHTSRDPAIAEPTGAARQDAADAPGFPALAEAHRAAWARLWQQSRIEVSAAGQPANVVNLHLFHVLQVAAPHVAELDVGLGARGLHGEGYLGHVFWDQLFVFPLLNLRFPRTSRALLRYRLRRLPAARRYARLSGEIGARFPWQSGSDGREETPTQLYNPRSGSWIPDRSAHQHHVGLAIAYDLWQHWQTTGDDAFLFEDGAEMLIEIARHFIGLTGFDEQLGRHRIRGVMGPDEFHDGYPWTDAPGIDDNAYTNVLTAWLLARVLELTDRLARDGRSDVLDRLGVDAAELARFDEISRGLHVPFHDGVISQFAGYERLEPLDLDAYRERYGTIGRLDLILDAEGDTVRRYQVAKQADTLMLCYLFSVAELREVLGRLGYELSDTALRRTVDHHTARAVHGSTLSRVVHAWVSARADRHASWRYFTEALAADMADTQGGTTAEGIHLGAMAGTVDILQRCYPGLETRAGALVLDPTLPDELDHLRFGIAYRGHHLDIHVSTDELTVASAPGAAAPITVSLDGQEQRLHAGRSVSRRLHRHPHAQPEPPSAATTSSVESDPVCGMTLSGAVAPRTSTYDGRTYRFCSPTCQRLFEAHPGRYVSDIGHGDGFIEP